MSSTPSKEEYGVAPLLGSDASVLNGKDAEVKKSVSIKEGNLTHYFCFVVYLNATWFSCIISLWSGDPLPRKWHIDLPVHFLRKRSHLWLTLDRLWIYSISLYWLASSQKRRVLQRHQIWRHGTVAVRQEIFGLHFCCHPIHYAWLCHCIHRPIEDSSPADDRDFDGPWSSFRRGGHYWRPHLLVRDLQLWSCLSANAREEAQCPALSLSFQLLLRYLCRSGPHLRLH